MVLPHGFSLETLAASMRNHADSATRRDFAKDFRLAADCISATASLRFAVGELTSKQLQFVKGEGHPVELRDIDEALDHFDEAIVKAVTR